MCRRDFLLYYVVKDFSVRRLDSRLWLLPKADGFGVNGNKWKNHSKAHETDDGNILRFQLDFFKNPWTDEKQQHESNK